MRNQQPRRSGKSATAVQYQRRYITSLLTREEACSNLQALGFEHIDKVPASGKGRIPARGKGPCNTDASLSWTADGQALHWCDFIEGDRGTIFADSQPVFDRAEAARRFRRAEAGRRKAEADTQAMHDQVALRARIRWQAAATTGTHQYVTIKQLSSLHNARIDCKSGALLIPMWVSGIGLVNLQSIYCDSTDSTKLVMKGGRAKGAYCVIGSLNATKQVFVTEGWATAASLFELYGLPVVVAFNAGNLMPVCIALRSRLPDVSVIVAGDDDRQKPKNTGRQMAIQAAEAIGATLLFPELCQCCTCTDWNDRAVCDRRCGRG